MTQAIYRAKISQQGSSDPFHHMNGKPCIAVDNGENTVTVYFTEGEVHSMMVPKRYISRAYLSDADAETKKRQP